MQRPAFVGYLQRETNLLNHFLTEALALAGAPPQQEVREEEKKQEKRLESRSDRSASSFRSSRLSHSSPLTTPLFAFSSEYISSSSDSLCSDETSEAWPRWNGSLSGPSVPQCSHCLTRIKQMISSQLKLNDLSEIVLQFCVKLECSIALSMGKCCYCADERKITSDGLAMSQYYRDGEGITEGLIPRQTYYCSVCKRG